MIVISFGVRKSGSTLAFEMTRAVLELNGHAQERLPAELVDDASINITGRWTHERLFRLLEVTEGRWVVVKTHGGANRLSPDVIRNAIAAGQLRIQLVVRDPRDGVLSMLDHGERARADGRPTLAEVVDVDTAIQTLEGDVRTLRTWGRVPSLCLRYEDFAFDPTFGPLAIAHDLAMEVDPAAVWERISPEDTKRNVARQQRHATEMSEEDARRVEQRLAGYLAFVAHDDRSFFEEAP